MSVFFSVLNFVFFIFASIVSGDPNTTFLKNNRTDFYFLEILGRTHTPLIQKNKPLKTIKKQPTSPNGTIKACSACVVAFKKSYQRKIHFAIILLGN